MSWMLPKLPMELASLVSLQARRRASTAAALKPRTEIPLSPGLRLNLSIKQLLRLYANEYPSQTHWERRLSWALEELETASLRKPRITFLGDTKACTTLLCALLADPFGSNDNILRSIQEGLHNSSNHKLSISWGSASASPQGPTLTLHSEWLRQSNVELEILDLDPLNVDSDLDHLHRSDLVVLLSTSLAQMRELRSIWSPLLQRRSFLLLAASRDIHDTELHKLAAPYLGDNGNFSWHVLPVNLPRLESAVSRLLSNDANVRANFSLDFGQSGILPVDDALRSFAARLQAPDAIDRFANQIFTAQKAAYSALRLAAADEEDSQEAFVHLASGRHHLEHTRTQIERGLQFAPTGSLTLDQEDIQEGRDALGKILQKRLTWWKLPLGRADDVYADLQQASYLFARALEAKLAFESGKVETIRQALDNETSALLKKSPFTPTREDARSFTSSVLFNQAEQLEAKAGPLTAATLSAPIANRRQQLMAPGGPVEHLQIKAQMLTLQTYALFGASSTIGYLSFMAEYLNLASSASSALFGIIFGAYRLQGGWQKAQSRFLQNYDRVQNGLQYDLQANASQVLDRKLVAKSQLVLEGLEGVAATRQAEAQVVAETASQVASDLAALADDFVCEQTA